MELMGNTLLRSQTAAYLQEKSGLFIRYVTDPDFQQTCLPTLDLSALKVKYVVTQQCDYNGGCDLGMLGAVLQSLWPFWVS